MNKKLKDILKSSLIGGLIAAIIGPIIDRGHSIPIMALSAFIAGFVIFSLILCYERFIKDIFLKQLPFISILAISTAVDVSIIFMAMIVTFSEMGLNEESVGILEMINRRDFSYGILLFGVLVLLIQFLSLLNRLIGQGVLIKILTGRYHRPVEQERFFMFLDMKGSTSIAEKIGHARFLSLLNDFFYDLSIGVESTQGEIYKYVGDEAIIVWTQKKGALNANCLECFFLLRDRIAMRRDRYLRKYGLVPEFKAGLHFGKVIVGEMGNFRQEIAYIGDAVNTTARIEHECNRLNCSFIASGEALALLTLPPRIRAESQGSEILRGREGKTSLYSITR